jgi:lysophospholipase L1-like esterase
MMLRRNFIKKSLILAGAFATVPELSLSHQNVEGLPKVVLIGDSIRIGYQSFVIRELDGIAEVWAPAENGRTTDNLIYHLHQWIKKQNPDLLHINAGLHDIRTLAYDLGPGNTIVKPEHYRDNLETIFSWVQKYVGCKIIWANTTPVIDAKIKARHEKAKDFTRYDADIKMINEIAKEVAKKYKVPVNDLYVFVKEHITEDEVKDDGVHYRPEGSEKLGIEIASVIKRYLYMDDKLEQSIRN